MSARKAHTDYKLRQYADGLRKLAADLRAHYIEAADTMEPVELEEIAEILEDLRTERGIR